MLQKRTTLTKLSRFIAEQAAFSANTNDAKVPRPRQCILPNNLHVILRGKSCVVSFITLYDVEMAMAGLCRFRRIVSDFS